MKGRTLSLVALAGAVACLGGVTALPRAHAEDAARSTYDFEDGTQGFTAMVMRDGQITPDAESATTLTKDKNLVKSGASALAYSYKVESKAVRALAAEMRVPANAAGLRFWIRSDAATAYILSARQENGPTFDLTFYVPANEWVPVVANWDELTPSDAKDRGSKVDPAQVKGVSLVDLTNVLASSGAELTKFIPDFKPARTVWLDDFQLSTARAPQSSGLYKDAVASSLVIDNFETGVYRWMPVRVDFAGNPPSFALFPSDASLKILPEAAGPGAGKTPIEPGGKGLRFSYKRAAKNAFGLNCSVEKQDLSRADRLRVSLNMSQKSLVIVQVKEKDDSEYNQIIMPDDSVGWRTLDLPLSSLTLGENSRDENNALDPGQIKEISIVDASGFLGGMLGEGDTTLELDAVSFGLK